MEGTAKILLNEIKKRRFSKVVFGKGGRGGDKFILNENRLRGGMSKKADGANAAEIINTDRQN